MKLIQYFDGHIVINLLGLMIRIKYNRKYHCPEVKEWGICTSHPLGDGADVNETVSNITNAGERTKKQLIVSLTSFPQRIHTVIKTIKTLLTQTIKPDMLILWLAPEQFPNREQDLPQELLDLKKYGLTIDWYKNIRSYKKIIPTLKKYPDAVIITTDDDIYYAPDTIESLYKSYLEHPNEIHAHRCDWLGVNIKKNCTLYKNNKMVNTLTPNHSPLKSEGSSNSFDLHSTKDDGSTTPSCHTQFNGEGNKICSPQGEGVSSITWAKTKELYKDLHRGEASFRHRLTGYGAVLYPPNTLYKDVTNEELITKTIPTHDDIWLWAMAVLAGTKTRLVKGYSESINYVEDSQQYGLCKINQKGIGMGLSEAYNIILKEYPQILDILKQEIRVSSH